MGIELPGQALKMQSRALHNCKKVGMACMAEHTVAKIENDVPYQCS